MSKVSRIHCAIKLTKGQRYSTVDLIEGGGGALTQIFIYYNPKSEEINRVIKPPNMGLGLYNKVQTHVNTQRINRLLVYGN